LLSSTSKGLIQQLLSIDTLTNAPGYTPSAVKKLTPKKETNLNQQSANSNASHNNAAILVHTEVRPDNRCHHQFANGTRCRRLTRYSDSQFCPRHAGAHPYAQVTDTDPSSAFGDEPTDFRSAAEINDFLAKLTSLLIQNRISSRRASVLAHISSLELRTLPAIDHELNSHDEFRPIIFGPPDPPSTTATSDNPS
jgi:hypothetical protein